MQGIYHYDNEHELVLTQANKDCTISKEDIEKLFTSNEYMQHEYDCMRVLYQYQFLNLYNFNRATRLLSTQPKKSYQNNIENMYFQGVLDCYRYKEGDSSLKAYSLSRAAYQYMAESKKQLRKTYFYHHQEDITTAEILEKLSVNQWHICVCEGYREKIVKEYAHLKVSYRDHGAVTIPSIVQIKTIAPRGKKLLTIVTLPLHKDETCIGDFLGKLLRLTGYLSENSTRFPNPIFLCCAESTKEATDTLNLIRGVPELADLTIGYVLDISTKESYPLEWINYCRYTDEGAFVQNCRIEPI